MADEAVRITFTVDSRRAEEQLAELLAEMQALADLFAVHGDEPDDEPDGDQ